MLVVTQAEGPAVPSTPPSNRLNLQDLKAQAEAGLCFPMSCSPFQLLQSCIISNGMDFTSNCPYLFLPQFQPTGQPGKQEPIGPRQ